MNIRKALNSKDKFTKDIATHFMVNRYGLIKLKQLFKIGYEASDSNDGRINPPSKVRLKWMI